MPFLYILCGLIVRSDLHIPELVEAPPEAQMLPDVTIIKDSLPNRLTRDDDPHRLITIDSEGAVLLNMPGRARLLVRHGREIIVDIDADNDGDWRLLLLGPVISFLFHQRGMLPLHAASLRIGNTTIAIAGVSGAGKSTLTHALMRGGGTLLSDDLTVVETGHSDIMGAPPSSCWAMSAGAPTSSNGCVAASPLRSGTGLPNAWSWHGIMPGSGLSSGTVASTVSPLRRGCDRCSACPRFLTPSTTQRLRIR
jgi:hypothetical protein